MAPCEAESVNEDDARDWCCHRFSPVALERLDRFAALVVAENARQNLISPATCPTIWSRHVTDSAQLATHAAPGARSWIDIGSGAGFPGLVIAIVTDMQVTLVEPRARRAEFLEQAAGDLCLSNVSVQQVKAEGLAAKADVISARAVASIPALLAMSSHMRHPDTRLILPRGRNGASEVADLPVPMRSMFHVEQSVTSSGSVIVVAQGVTG
jgi:16S rRNA (guanine527-N7)-methyltransferase